MTSITILVDHLSVEKRTFLTGNENWVSRILPIPLPSDVETLIESFLPDALVQATIVQEETGYIQCFDEGPDRTHGKSGLLGL